MPGALPEETRAIAGAETAHTRLTKPLTNTGLLKAYVQNDLTPVIGTEFDGVQAIALLEANNSDDLIRDLAATISQRGVVFLRKQDISPTQMRTLVERISDLAGCVRSLDSLCWASADDH